MALPSNNNGVISSYGNLLNLLLYLWNVFSPFPLTNVNTILDYLSYLRFGILWLRHFVLLGSWTVTYKLLLRGDNIPPPLSFTLTRLSSYLRCKGKCNENIQVEPAIHGQREICLNYKTKAISSGSVASMNLQESVVSAFCSTAWRELVLRAEKFCQTLPLKQYGHN